jgi:AraC-like DNA-binding protein
MARQVDKTPFSCYFCFMNRVDHFNKLLAVDQPTQLTAHAAGLICDKAILEGLQFSQSVDGHYSVAAVRDEIGKVPQWAAGALTVTPSEEIPPHNPRYISTQLSGNGTECKYVGYGNIEDFARARELNPHSLRTNFGRVLGRCPGDYIVKGDYQGRAQEIGIKLNALSMAARIVSKAPTPRLIYGDNYRSREAQEHARELFLTFCQEVLTPPEE